jgi:phytoene dehydrogenase-like protein
MGEQYQVFTPVEDEVKWPVYSVPTVTAPELAPRGGSIVEAFPPVPQERPANEWTAQQAEEIVTATVKTLSHLHQMDIAVTRVRSPCDFQNQLHLYQGAVYGLSPAAELRAYFQHTTPIGGLFQAGQTTYPGYGVSSAAMSGILAAEALLRMAKR